MDEIEPDHLYDDRGQPNGTRPRLQGDVFDRVVLPGFGDELRKVQIVAHPCSMRRGSELLGRITVAPVEAYQEVTGDMWQGHLRVMPLPYLVGDRHFAAKFADVTACPVELLNLDQRIATLTNRGIYVLQQRLVMHYTRLGMDLEALRTQSAPVLMEAEIVTTWLETVLTAAEIADDDALAAETEACELWMTTGDPSPQARLSQEVNHLDVRRKAAQAARARAAARK